MSLIFFVIVLTKRVRNVDSLVSILFVTSNCSHTSSLVEIDEGRAGRFYSVITNSGISLAAKVLTSPEQQQMTEYEITNLQSQQNSTSSNQPNPFLITAYQLLPLRNPEFRVLFLEYADRQTLLKLIPDPCRQPIPEIIARKFVFMLRLFLSS
ncbi:hypothetical protein BLNAU_24303 [Blattamonas nauphoetae]|uniref:Protein kinase domain-containing protein n=1 Tax=Blattamonas nauphoetae TaxID=2049346 RepID=A0ABQ9WMS7_9EUKA|nr:hypothetical protein BLNAU_24303 [Blattamonas nauphoetae]